MSYYTSQKEVLRLNEKPLGSGGEGTVYEIISPLKYQNRVVKIYHPKEQSKARELKLLYMLSNPPKLEGMLVVWPEDIIYSDIQGEKFVGYLMPKAEFGYDATHLCTLSIPDKLGSAWQEKFNRATPEGMMNRLSVCINLARTFEQIHQNKKYVFIDIKPENIKVSLNGQVTILDCDSIAVMNQDRLMFPAEKASPEYSPREIKKLDVKSDPVDESWDRFSLAVVFYKVLMGLHPFTGTCYKPYDKLDTYAQKIQEGLLPIGSKVSQFRVIPKPHGAFEQLSPKVQKLFIQCFEEGHKTPSKRPSATQWLAAFQKVESLTPSLYFINRPKRRKRFRLPSLKIKTSAMLKVIGGSAAMITVTTMFAVQLNSYQVPASQLVNLNQPLIEELTPAEIQKKLGGFLGRFKEGVAKNTKNGKISYVNQKGKQITRKQYDYGGRFNDGTARVGKNNHYGHIDRHGNEIIPLEYDWVGDFKEGLAKVVKNGKTGYVNRSNQEVIKFSYEYGGDFHNGFAMVQKDNKWGFINQKGQEVIPLRFQKVLNFYDGLAAVKQNGKWGFINKQGYLAIPPKYTWASSFVDGLALVRIDFQEFYIDKTGKGKIYNGSSKL